MSANGRKIRFISYDDAYSPPKTVEQARRLVESDEVFLIFGTLGTPTNTAIQKYMNTKKVPQLFVVRPNGMIQGSFPGLWVGRPTTRTRLGFTQGIF